MYGQHSKDSAGIYTIKKDFSGNRLYYSTPYCLKEKFGFLHSDFYYEAEGTILLRQANKKFLSFEPGSIFGFYSEGKKFLYIPGIRKYLFVLNEEPITILIREDVTYFRYFSHTNLLLFYLNNQNELKRMNDQNLNNDFSKDSNRLAALTDIQKRFEEMKKNQKLNLQEISKYIKERLSEKK